MRIEVHGIPAPQGSKRHVGGGRMAESSRAVGPWREAVRAETQRWLTDRDSEGFPRETPVNVEIFFSLPRPATAPKRVLFPAKRPDLDKLVRAVLDGVVAGGALADDSQVVTLLTWKRFTTYDGRPGFPPGCNIDIVEETEV